jgi:hypothetical protein
MENENFDSSDDSSDEFKWEEYLEKNNSEAAPASCFCQSVEVPVNEFKVGHKVETYDPRNTSSACIATIIETSGPRIRLRYTFSYRLKKKFNSHNQDQSSFPF